VLVLYVAVGRFVVVRRRWGEKERDRDRSECSRRRGIFSLNAERCAVIAVKNRTYRRITFHNLKRNAGDRCFYGYYCVLNSDNYDLVFDSYLQSFGYYVFSSIYFN
jgi:hypothetical protein